MFQSNLVFFLRIVRVDYDQVKRREGCIRVSVIIRHKFHLGCSCCSDVDPLVFENQQPTSARL